MSRSPGLSYVPANHDPTITCDAPAASARATSRGWRTPPSAHTLPPASRAAAAHSSTADNCGRPTAVIIRVVHIAPGPTPTFTTSAPAASRSRVPCGGDDVAGDDRHLAGPGHAPRPGAASILSWWPCAVSTTSTSAPAREEPPRRPRDVAVDADRDADPQPAARRRGPARRVRERTRRCGSARRPGPRASTTGASVAAGLGAAGRTPAPARRRRRPRSASSSQRVRRHHAVQLGEPVHVRAVAGGDDADRRARPRPRRRRTPCARFGIRCRASVTVSRGPQRERRLQHRVPALDPADHVGDHVERAGPGAARPAPPRRATVSAIRRPADGRHVGRHERHRRPGAVVARQVDVEPGRHGRPRRHEERVACRSGRGPGRGRRGIARVEGATRGHDGDAPAPDAARRSGAGLGWRPPTSSVAIAEEGDRRRVPDRPHARPVAACAGRRCSKHVRARTSGSSTSCTSSSCRTGTPSTAPGGSSSRTTSRPRPPRAPRRRAGGGGATSASDGGPAPGAARGRCHGARAAGSSRTIGAKPESDVETPAGRQEGLHRADDRGPDPSHRPAPPGTHHGVAGARAPRREPQPRAPAAAAGRGRRRRRHARDGDRHRDRDGAAARARRRGSSPNMEASLEVPTATSVRGVPAKLLIDNRIVINNHLKRARGGKVSFTHLDRLRARRGAGAACRR